MLKSVGSNGAREEFASSGEVALLCALRHCAANKSAARARTVARGPHAQWPQNMKKVVELVERYIALGKEEREVRVTRTLRGASDADTKGRYHKA